MPIINVTIPGVPVSKKRPRFVRRGKFVGTYNCQDTEEGKFKWELLKEILPYRIGEGPLAAQGVPVVLIADFYMPIPSMSNKKRAVLDLRHIKKPDADNLLKFLKDCGNGVLWADDSQVCEVTARKIYSDKPRTEITVTY